MDLARIAYRSDREVGQAVHRVIARHHRRRLSRLGWLGALDAPRGGWASGYPSPRTGNAVDVLVDGAAALPEIACALEQAQSHVHLTGWYLTPEFALRRGETVLRNLLAEVAERVEVRLLLWAGAPLPLFRPSRRMVREMRERLVRGTKIRCVLDDRERPMHCHHEKTIVVDDAVSFVGGIDLTSEAGDRFDTADHVARGRVGWHDAAARLRGPVVVDVAEHFRLRWQEVSAERLGPPAAPAAVGDVEVQVVRTVPENLYQSLPRGDFRILESYMRALRSAERLIYLENQFLWSPEILTILREKLSEPPSDEFRLLVVLPSRPNDGADDTRGGLAELIEADSDQRRFLACTLYARVGRLIDRVYVHAKIGIVDDAWLTIGSANLNEHSLFNDTEMNIVSHDEDLARQTRLRLWGEHLELPVEDVDGPSHRVIDEQWRPIATEQLQRLQSRSPLTHRLVELPHLSRRSRRLLGPLQGLLVDG